MSTTPKELMERLEAGDLLQAPITLPIDGTQTFGYATVLRREGDQIYLTCFTEHGQGTKVCDQNPFRWDDAKNALVNRHGEVPRWYSDGIQRHVRESVKIAEAYAKIPRKEHLKGTVSITDESVEQFANSPMLTVIGGLVQNGEAGGSETQIALLLEQLGMPYNTEQLMALVSYVQMYSTNRLVQQAKMDLALIVTAPGVAQEVGEGCGQGPLH